jgi:hypothetical protein
MTLDSLQYGLMILTFPVAVLMLVMSLKLRTLHRLGFGSVLVLWFAFTAYTTIASVLAWNIFGLADFITAVGLGIASQPNSPLQIFASSPGTAVLAALPWRFIPSFFVPLFILTHVALFVRLGNTTRSA